MSDLLAAAIELHQAGQLEAAAELYETLLAQDKDNADVLHLVGVLFHQQGDHARAVDLIGRAVALRPDDPAFHANQAEACRALGQHADAVECCKAALRLAPDFPEALCNLGLALQGLGRHSEAAEQCRHAVRLRPDFASAHNALGISLRELRDSDGALNHLRRAVELDPTSALAFSNLGQCLVDCGHSAEALPHCQKAVRLQPGLAPLYHNLGNAFRALARLDEACDAYRDALQLDDGLALAHAHLGLVLQEQGQLQEALPELRRAVELEPNDAMVWGYLAELHAEREEPAEAIACWERVLALEPERPSGHIGLGWALQEEGQLAAAGEHYRVAAKLQAASGVAQLHLGGWHEELGELADAEACFRAALQLQPDYALPHARLATLLRGRLPEADRAALERRLADPQLGPGPRARLLFGLAHVLDAQREYARAADCLQNANALTLGLQRGAQRYMPAEHARFVEMVRETFGCDFFARMAGAGLPTRRPVFVFGLPRSGTTLIEQILASHSLVHGAGELPLGRRSLDSFRAVLGSALPFSAPPALDAAKIRLLAEQHHQWLRAIDGGGVERIVDKMPDNYLYLGLLAAMFPQAAFIHCRRDLRDIAVSCWMTDFRSIRWANDVEHMARRFQQYCRLMDHWRTVLPVPMCEVSYEDTVGDLEAVARRVVAACGLAWDPACLEFHKTQRPVRTASVTQVRQPVYKQSAGRWQNYATPLAGLFAALPSGC